MYGPILMTEYSHPWQQDTIIRHSQRLIQSYQHWVGQPLIDISGGETPAAIAQALFEAPFAILSHGTEPDPILNYGNRIALELWEMSWAQFTQMPSRYTAEPTERSDRAQLLAQAKHQGYIKNCQGIRVSKSGRRFLIKDITVWDVLDEAQQLCGQAATYAHWEFLEPIPSSS